MKKVYLIGALAAMLLGACSGDDGQGAGSGAGGPQGGQAYLTVRIMDAGTATRATGNSTAPFENGTDGERKVTDARFFFYDGAGKFVTEASVWNGGTATTGKQNVEFNGNSVIVLQGLEETGYPKYMVTVLNAPAAFVPGETLTEMETARSGGIYTAAGTADNFIMSTTSYARPDATPYYVTELKSTDFHAEPATPSAIDVYVEPRGEEVNIDITDTGKGMEKSQYKAIFTPGYTTKKRGWGLGLSLARRIVEEYHHGRIFVKHSEPGVGTTFRIVLKK